MAFLRIALSVFSILNVVFWGVLAWAWAVRPAWAARIPLHLGVDERYRKSSVTWSRLAAAFAGFWSVAAVLYLTVASNPAAFVVLFVLAAIFLILGIGAAARLYHILQLPEPAAGTERHRQAV